LNQDGKLLRPLGRVDAQGRSLFLDQDGQVVAQDPEVTPAAAAEPLPALPGNAGPLPAPVDSNRQGAAGQPLWSRFSADVPADAQEHVPGGGRGGDGGRRRVGDGDGGAGQGVSGQTPGAFSPPGGAAASNPAAAVGAFQPKLPNTFIIPGAPPQGPDSSAATAQGTQPQASGADPVQGTQPQPSNPVAVQGTQPQASSADPAKGEQPQFPNTIFIPWLEGGVHVPVVSQSDQSATVTQTQTERVAAPVGPDAAFTFSSPRDVSVTWEANAAVQNSQSQAADHRDNVAPGSTQIPPPDLFSVPEPNSGDEARSTATTSPDPWWFGTQATPGQRSGDDGQGQGQGQGLRRDPDWPGAWIPDSATGQWLLDISGRNTVGDADGPATKILPGSVIS